MNFTSANIASAASGPIAGLIEALEKVVQIGPFVNADVRELFSDLLFEVLEELRKKI